MTWLKVDDGMMSHPKIVTLSDGAFRLFFEVLSLCARHLTDGQITGAALRALRGATPARIRELTRSHAPGAAPLLEPVGEGVFQVHDFLEYQPSRAKVLQAREATAKRTEAWRGRESARRDATGDAGVTASHDRHDGPRDGVCDAGVTLLPSPSPSPPQDQERTARAREGKTTETHRVSPHRVRAGHPKTHWFCGANFCVSYLQHDLLERELGARRDQVELDGLYPRWDAGDPVIDNLLPWLKARIAEQVRGLQRAGPVHAPKPWACRLHAPPCADPHEHCQLMERESGRPWHFVAERQQCEAVPRTSRAEMSDDEGRGSAGS